MNAVPHYLTLQSTKTRTVRKIQETVRHQLQSQIDKFRAGIEFGDIIKCLANI